MIETMGWRAVPLLSALTIAACEDSSLPTPPPPPPPGFTLSVLQSVEHFTVPTRLLPLDLIIHRDEGFDEPITFRSESPTEIVVQFNPGTVAGSNRTDVSIVAATGAARTRHEIGLIGRSQGGVERRLIVELTIE